VARKQDKWADVIAKLGLDVTKPINFLTATEIKIAVNEEPRLMDSEDALPSILRDNRLFVLPVSRNRYAIVRGRGYHELEDAGPPIDFPVRLPIDLTSLTYGRGESRFLLHAYHSNLLSDFSGVKELFPTVAGKMATRAFRFHIDGFAEIEVDRAGMEVDFGFEGPTDLLLFEAKAVDRTSFLVRQLYYPYRAFKDAMTKSVRPFFFVADQAAGTYSVWEYEWPDPTDYESIQLRRAKRYHLVEGRPLTDQLLSVEPDPALTKVPQADDLEKVAELPFLVQEGVRTAADWAKRKGITLRQGSYYREAAESLGLVRLVAGQFELTEEGRRFVGLPPAERDAALALRVLRNRVMNQTLKLVLERGERGAGDEEIANLIRRLSNLGGSTPLRRAKSVRSYFAWIGQASGGVVVSGQRIYSREGWTAKTQSDSHPARIG
jgi:hypothetical protein